MPFNDRAIWLLMSRPTTWFGTAHPLLQSPISFTLIIPETRSRIKNEKKKREKEKSGGRECARRGARWCDNTAALRHTTTMPGAHNLAARSGCINSSWLPALFPHTHTHTVQPPSQSSLHRCSLVVQREARMASWLFEDWNLKRIYPPIHEATLVLEILDNLSSGREGNLYL